MNNNVISRRRLMAMAGAFGAAMGAGLKIQPASAALADKYELIDLGVTGQAPRADRGLNFMNNQGVAVGTMVIDAEKDSPWIWRDGKLTKIKTGQYGGRANVVNHNGVVGGREIIGWTNETTAIGRPVLWRDGEKEVLPYPDIAGANLVEGAVTGVADDDRAFGWVMADDSRYFPVSWENGAAIHMETLFPEGMGYVSAATPKGAVFGASASSSESVGAFWFSSGSVTRIQYESIDGMTDWSINSMDSTDRLLGSVQFGGRVTAAWSHAPEGQPQLMSDVSSDQEASMLYCSDGGTLFGGSITVGGKVQAAVWSDGEGIELKSLVKSTKGLRLLDVLAITSDGMIALNGKDGDGNRHAVILQPV